ncbi:hypothetical protein Tco_0612778 [Tanacetum coccineum]
MNRRISTKHWLTPTKVTNSYLTHMETLSRLKDVEIMRIKDEVPLLDQSGGLEKKSRKRNRVNQCHQGKDSQDNDKSTEGETTDKLDWINPECQQYPHDLRNPLPLIPNSRGRQVIPFDHFINNDLAYLSGGVSSRKYSTSVTKTKAVDYRHIKWIKDLILNRMWSQVPVSYDKDALWGISHWG